MGDGHAPRRTFLPSTWNFLRRDYKCYLRAQPLQRGWVPAWFRSCASLASGARMTQGERAGRPYRRVENAARVFFAICWRCAGPLLRRRLQWFDI
jgi:hypothetical protein